MILEMNKVQPVKWCMKQTKLTSEISFPTDSLLAQSVECKTDYLEIVGSIPNFFILLFTINDAGFCQDLAENNEWKRLHQTQQLATSFSEVGQSKMMS